MRRPRFQEEPIATIIQEYTAGAKVLDLCCQHHPPTNNTVQIK